MEIAREQIIKLQEKVQDLETRLGALNDKINLENGMPSAPRSSLPTEVVTAPAAHGSVIPKAKTIEKKAPPVSKVKKNEAFASNESVDRFREAKILFDSKRYSDAVVEFSEFIKNEPDHALAPAAQYYLGMSYYHQKEYKMAEEELSRVLLSYAHSSYIPDTLASLAQVSLVLKKPNRVLYFKEKLQSQFPNSPQAKSLTVAQNAVAKEAPAPRQMETTDEPKVIEGPKTPETPNLNESEHP